MSPVAAQARCPSWCAEKEPHSANDVHFSTFSRHGAWSVSLVWTNSWDAPRVHVCQFDVPGHTHMWKLPDAIHLADVLEDLGRKKLAGLVRMAIEKASASDAAIARQPKAQGASR